MIALIFEDDVYLEEEIVSILEKKGFDVKSFNSSEEAIQWLTQTKQNPDIALLDIIENATFENEEKFGGFEIAKILTTINASFPIAFLTAHEDGKVLQSMAAKYSPIQLCEKRQFIEIETIQNKLLKELTRKL